MAAGNTPMHDPRRLLPFPGLLNGRDLGGYPTRDGGTTRFRSLLRSDDLHQLTPEGLRSFGDFGIRTVIDLRWPEEIAAWPNPVPRELNHVRYESVSLLAGSSREWRELAHDTPKELWKCAVLRHVRGELRTVLTLIADAPPEPLLFHCVAGKDRTGLIAALMLTLADVLPEAIAWDYAASGPNLEAEYLRRYADWGEEAVRENVRCPEEGVHRMLAALEESGGVTAYLQTLGLDADRIARLRARLRD